MSLEEYFRGKRVLVTGAGRGIGRAIAERLYEYGSIVFALSRQQATLASLAEKCPKIIPIAVDLEDWEATKAAVETIGYVDCLINNAGVLISQSFLDVTPEAFDKIFSTNVKAVVNVSQVVAKAMIAKGGGGSIVNISSIAGYKHIIGGTTYCATKGALNQLTRSMAIELGPHRIRVNSINPAFHSTDLVEDDFMAGVKKDEFLKFLTPRMPLGEVFLEMDKLVNMTLFLLSGLASTMNGQHVVVDGGFLCS